MFNYNIPIEQVCDKLIYFSLTLKNKFHKKYWSVKEFI